ncbi:MAG: TetR/AcrR family transcriptional regulator [Gammaproteobacteria bacterium]
MKRTRRKSKPAERLGPQAWVAAARTALIEGGIARVKVAPLAQKLGVTTGSFYWHFEDLPALHAAMLTDWESTNTEPMFAAVAGNSTSAHTQLQALVDLWVSESGYSPRWDAAVRDWARVSKEVESSVRRVDDRRLELLHTIFKRAGYAEPEALVRARITYFHQVGYYALHIVERLSDRLRLKPLYIKALLGPEKTSD